jgi:nucleotide-binding universal stress UspA family protein
MTTSELTPVKNTPVEISPLRVKQVLVGIGMDKTDGNMLKYLGYFNGFIAAKNMSFVHVIPGLELFEKRNEPESEYQADENIIKEVVRDICEDIERKGKTKVKLEVLEGNPLEELMHLAEMLHPDLIVIGKSISEDAHGILTKNFVRKVKGKALIVPGHSQPALKNILVPFDFSPHAIKALQTAISLNKSLGNKATITALNVFEMPSMQAYLLRRSEDELRDLLLRDRKDAFESFINNYIPAADKHMVQTHIIEQSHSGAGEFIMDYVEKSGADFLVMGAKGHSKVGLLLIGSVTEKVLSLTKNTPVLVVK